MSERSSRQAESSQADAPPSDAPHSADPEHTGAPTSDDPPHSADVDHAGTPTDDHSPDGQGGSPWQHDGGHPAAARAHDPAHPFEMADSPFLLTESDDEDKTDTGRTRERSSRTKKILLGSLLAIGLAGAVVVGTTVTRIVSQKDATLVAPPEIGTLRVDSSENGLQTADYLTTALSADVDLDKAVGAIYTDGGATDRGVLFFGGTTLIWTPEADLDTAMELIADDQGAVTGLREVDAGELGGTMKCGKTVSPDGDIAVCGWADHGSLALAMFPNRTEQESAALLLEIRNAAQTRN